MLGRVLNAWPPSQGIPHHVEHICVEQQEIFFLIFFYFWVCWVFSALQGLSLVLASQATLHFSAQASHCGGFSCCGAQALEQGLSSCSTWV